MGLLEYQVMPSLRDVAHDGVLCTFSNRSALNRDKWCGQGRTVHHIQNLTPLGHSSSQPGGPPYWASPLAFGLIGGEVGVADHTPFCSRLLDRRRRERVFFLQLGYLLRGREVGGGGDD